MNISRNLATTVVVLLVALSSCAPTNRINPLSMAVARSLLI